MKFNSLFLLEIPTANNEQALLALKKKEVHSHADKKKYMTRCIRIISDSRIAQKKFYKTPQLLIVFKRCTYFSEPTHVRRISVLVKVLISIQTLGGESCPS